MISPEEYIQNPCAAFSIPYWKAKTVTVPDGMKILHQEAYDEDACRHYIDEPYFRLRHDLQNLSAPVLPRGYSLCTAAPAAFASHINGCYAGIGISKEALQGYTDRPVYDADLWLTVQEDHTRAIVATGIAELDREVGEGVLEWIQVTQEHRGRGLGRYLVLELLRRMQGKADFATVSGQCNNAANPEKLYRECGFTGNDIWHILREK